MRPLGETQKAVLRALEEHGSWRPGGRCGWLWDTDSGTRRLMDSLVKRGFVVVRNGTYWPVWKVGE